MYAVATMAIDKGKLMGIFVDVTHIFAICYTCTLFLLREYEQNRAIFLSISYREIVPMLHTCSYNVG
jgi:hypothetical protein